jgi:hypothetical protein
MAEDIIINKVAQSGLVTINLETYLPKEQIIGFDMKAFLFMELILKEKDFREALKTTSFEKYKGAIVAIFCSTDAIIPVWAYMLATTYLQPVAQSVHLNTPEATATQMLLHNINAIDTQEFVDQRIVIKGCGEIPIANEAYTAITAKLVPVAKSLMYGEPCSTVPLFKKK